MVTKSKRDADQKTGILEITNSYNSEADDLALHKPVVYNERAKAIKQFIERAIQNHKIFSVFGPYDAIRSGLYKRGWLEKKYTPISKKKIVKVITKLQTDYTEEEESLINSSATPDPEFDIERDGDVRVIASWMLRRIVPNLIWTRRRLSCNRFLNFQRDQILNHFTSADFTSKVGLNSCLQDAHWFGEDIRTFYPRSYCIGQHEEKMAFIEDFRLSACLGVLKWIVLNMRDNKQNEGKLLLRGPMKIINIALAQCERFIHVQNHYDVDNDMEDSLSPEQWDSVLRWYYLMAEDRVYVNRDDAASRKCHQMLIRMKSFCPQMEVDGYSNVWIVKPGAKSRGVGIKLLDKLSDILNLVDSEVTKATKYIVQKYIERPLLIHNTKFDIRQWFLVTDWNPLTIYMYKECYLRFCSQPFSLRLKMDAVHLCNNAIQKKYIKRSEPRMDNLPQELMWGSEEFKDYLTLYNKERMWTDVIYPGMKKAIITTMLCAQETVEFRKGSFELFGADFMVTEDYRPWLIEINASPCVAPSTEITARMCAQMLDDVLKVVLDRAEYKNNRTGLFEMIYKEPVTNISRITCPTFTIVGIPLFPPPTWNNSLQQGLSSKIDLVQDEISNADDQVKRQEEEEGNCDEEKFATESKVEDEYNSKENDFFKVEQLFAEEIVSGCFQNQIPYTKIKKSATSTVRELPVDDDDAPTKMKKANSIRGVNDNDKIGSGCYSLFCEPGSLVISPVYGQSSEISTTKTDSQTYRRVHPDKYHGFQDVYGKWFTSHAEHQDPQGQENFPGYFFPSISPRNTFKRMDSEKALSEFQRSPPVLVNTTNQLVPMKRKIVKTKTKNSHTPVGKETIQITNTAETEMEKLCRKFNKSSSTTSSEGSAMKENDEVPVKGTDITQNTPQNKEQKIEKTIQVIHYRGLNRKVCKRSLLPSVNVVSIDSEITDGKALAKEQSKVRPNSSDPIRKRTKRWTNKRSSSCSSKTTEFSSGSKDEKIYF